MIPLRRSRAHGLHGRSGRSPLSWLLPVIAGVLVLSLVVGVALATGRSNLDAAKQARLADRVEMVARFDQTGVESYQAQTGAQFDEAAPFSPADAEHNEMLLRAVRTSPAGQEVVGTAVATADGTLVGSRPSGMTFPPGVLTEAIDGALEDGAERTEVFELEGEPVWAVLNAIGGDEPWGVLIMVEPLVDGWMQRLYEALGPLGHGDGGLTLVDPDGVVVASWDADLIGQRLDQVPPAGTTPEPVVTRADVGGETVVRIATRSPGGHTTLIYEESDASLFADLTEAQQRHDRLVLSAALLAVVLLVGVSLIRHRRIHRSEDRTREMLAHARDIVLVVDPAGAIRFVSPAVTPMLGHEPGSLIDTDLTDLCTPEGADALRTGLEDAVANGRCSVLGVELTNASGHQLWFDLHLADHPHPDIDGVLVTCHEIGDRRRLEEELSHRASHDALTGLGNRLTFDAALARVAQQGEPFAVMMIDLDRFKPLNDSLGHDAGDTALRLVAEALDQGVRASDVVCRLGGDEFGVIAPNTETERAQRLAERLVARIEATWPSIDESAGLGASIGVVTAHGPAPFPHRLLREADSAMYQAKLQGGSRAVVVDASEQSPHRHPAWSTDVASDDRSGDVHVVAPAPEPEPNPSSPPRPVTTGRATRWHFLPLWGLAVAVTIGLLVAGRAQSDARISELESDRIADRTKVTEAIAVNIAGIVDMDALIPVVASSPWPFEESPEVVDYVLSRYADPTALGDSAFAVVARRDTSIVAAHPSDATITIDPDDPYWQAAFDGSGYASPVVRDGDDLRIYYVVPMVLGDTIDTVLVMATDPSTTDWSRPLVTLGALSEGPGGLSLVDENGTVHSSWDPGLIGDQLVTADLLDQAQQAGSHAVDRDADGGETVAVAVPIDGSHSPTYAVWTQPSESMFADLNTGRDVRDGALGAVLVIALLGLTLVSWRQERQLRRNEQLVDTLLHEAHDMIVVAGPDLTVRFVSAAASRHLGIDRDDIVGHGLDTLLGPDASAEITNQLSGSSPGRAFGIERVTVPGTDGDRHFDIDVADLRRHDAIGGYLLTCHEVGDRTSLEELLSSLASRDALTGLLNRAQFGVHLDELSQRRANQAGTDAVVYIDLDHFKPVNDEFGHQAGDELLRVIAARLEESVRAEDMVCRLGGDEFALLLTDCDLATAESTVERLLAAIRHPVPLSEGVVQLDASIGVALSRHDITNAEQLVREADQAMYAAKRAGRGRYVLDR